MSRHTWGAPPPRPDYGDTPNRHGGSNFPPTVPVPLTPSGQPAPQLPPPPPLVQVYPWWDKQWENAPAWAVQSLNAVIPIGASAATTGLVPNFSYQVPAQNRAVLKSLRMTVENPLATIVLALTLFVNNSPVQGWTGIPFDPLSATAYVLVFNEMNIRLDQNQILTAGFTERSAPPSAWTVSLTASGWQIQSTEIARVQQGFRY